MFVNDSDTTTERAPDYRVIVSWVEITRHNGREMRLNFSKTFVQETLEAATAFRARALMSNGWTPPHACEVEIELLGRDVPRDDFTTPQMRREGIAMMRKAAKEATSPLFKGVHSPLGPDLKSLAAGERAAS